MINPNSITLRMLCNFVHNKIRMNVPNHQVVSVVSVLFDEILKDLKKKKTVRIFNFGKLYFQENEPKKYFDLFKQAVCISSKKRQLKFELQPRFKKYFNKKLDIDKILKNDYNK